jgi:hypothetical protein
MDSTDLAVFKPDFDSARVERGTGEDVFDNPFCEASGALVFLQDDGNRKAGVDVFSVVAVHAKGFSTVSVSARSGYPSPAVIIVKSTVCRHSEFFMERDDQRSYKL